MGKVILFAPAAAGRRKMRRIEVEYHRITQVCQEEEVWFVEVFEQLTLDREEKTIELCKTFGEGHRSVHRYEMREQVDELFAHLDREDFFSQIEGNPADVVDDPREAKMYQIRIDYALGSPRILQGSFDKNGLPVDFADFAKAVQEVLWCYDWSEVLMPSVYARVRRRRGEYIYCGVTFPGSGMRYSYLTDDDSIQVGDFVVAPAGEDNCESIVQVESVAYFAADEVPYPLEKTKRILRKCTEEECRAAEKVWY